MSFRKLLFAVAALAVAIALTGCPGPGDPAPRADEVRVTPATATVERGQTQQFDAEVLPANVSQAVSWSISDVSVDGVTVTISPDGLLSVVGGPGGAFSFDVVATATGTDVSGTARVNVPLMVALPDTPPRSVNVSPGTAAIRPGESRQFEATVLPTAASDDVEWSIDGDEPRGATISAAGLFTLPATATIGDRFTVRATATGTTIAGTATVTVSAFPPEDVIIATVPPGVTTVTRGGEPVQFSATVLPATAAQAVRWVVSPSGAGTFSAAGAFTIAPTVAHDAEVTITAVPTIASSVVSNPITLSVIVNTTAVTITSPPTELARGAEHTFAATVTPAGAPPVVWSVTPAAAGTFEGNVFTVSDTVALGEITITATSGGVSDSVEVEVYNAPTGVEITTPAANVLQITRGVPMQFVGNSLPVAYAADWPIVFSASANAGTFDDQNRFTVNPALPHGDPITITASVVGRPTVNATREFTVNVPVTGVRISPEQVNFTQGVAGEIRLTRSLYPTGANSAGVAWGPWVLAANAPPGVTINQNGDLTVTAAVPLDATFNVTTSITAPIQASHTATVRVVEPGQASFRLEFVGFADAAAGVGFMYPVFVIGTPGAFIEADNLPPGATVRWYVGTRDVGVGPSLEITTYVYENRFGDLDLTMVVTLQDGRRYSQRVTITVYLNYP